MDAINNIQEDMKGYLGEYDWNIYSNEISKKEFKFFKEFPINVLKSYLVLGKNNHKLLDKFKAYYLTRRYSEIREKNLKRSTPYEFDMLSYAKVLSSNTKEEYDLADTSQAELVFLYRHAHSSISEYSEAWLQNTILNKVAERNRDGLVTIILSEQHMLTLENSGEFEVINLSKVKQNQAIREALKGVQTKLTPTDGFKVTINNDGTVY